MTQASPGASLFRNPTTLAFAPDGRLFFAQSTPFSPLGGLIHYVTLDSNFQVVGSVGRIDTINNLSAEGRSVTGMVFLPNGDLIVSHSDGRLYDPAVDTSSGAISRLTAASNFTDEEPIVSGLPRSRLDHGPNGMVVVSGFNGRYVYLALAGMTNAGLVCRTHVCSQFAEMLWTAPETEISGSIVTIDLESKVVVGMVATGFRNPYDLLLHSNALLYVNDNGPNAAAGEKPSGGAGGCGVSGMTPSAQDELNVVVTNSYYGHPNPARNECTYADFAGTGSYMEPIYEYGSNTSSNGLAEYTSSVMSGLQGRILTANYVTGDIVSVKLLTGTHAIGAGTLRIGLSNPLDVVVRPSDGAIFIAEFGAARISVLRPRRTPAVDYTGDRRSDLVHNRPSTGAWYIRDTATGAVTSYAWGLSFPGDDVARSMDYDGDGQSDLVIYRQSESRWFIRTSSNGYSWPNETWMFYGEPGDQAVPRDYDGDGRGDLALYRATTGQWFVRDTATGVGTFFDWGMSFVGDDLPRPMDYDGDGRADLAVYRQSQGRWFIRTSSTGWSVGSQTVIDWGQAGDVPLTADFSGDGRDDLVIYRPSTGQWFIRDAATGATNFYNWGVSFIGDDVPRPMDYDGDGIADLAIYRQSESRWFIRTSSTGYAMPEIWFFFGQPGDVPLGRLP